MGSNIYTRQGDKGTTALANGNKVPKDAARVEAYGCVDEANSWIGVARAALPDQGEAVILLQSCLELLQNRLYNCSSNLATPPGSPFDPPRVSQQDVEWLEQAIDRFERDTGPLQSFVLPGGSPGSAMLHVARTVCRRAERRLVSLIGTEPLDPLVLKFINRSSDFLFAAARFANHASGVGDVSWSTDTPRPILS